jgi:DNA-binding transcriptional MerR regulator
MTTVTEGDATSRASGARLTIGKVLDSLRGEFPDVSPSKIRFLEAEGLIQPERTVSGYRTYSERDIARLRYVLVAQRDRYWPLKVIRDALDAIDRGLPDPGESANARSAVPAPTPDPEVPDAAKLRSSAPLSLTAREVREGAGLDKDTFAALLDFGLLRPDQAGHFDEHDLAVAAAACTLAQHGLEPRHLRPFRNAADREVGLAEQLVATTRQQSRQDRTAEIVTACLRLHVALVKGGLARR